MPALSPPSLLTLNNLVARNASASAIATNATANTTSNVLQVVCAWPVSGQYGPGSRILYYVLIAACIFARKMEWLRHACLAAALLFPAVAALHGIVLSAVRSDSAVDMDVFGAFQLCSIGILAGPITVKISRTYFYDPGRNAIFLWTGLILAGLLSLTVQFFRITTHPCPTDDAGNPISTDPKKFPYGNATCGLVCDVVNGPFSPMRQDSANNIYVIPAPHTLTFGMGTLLAAACCIPAILSLVSMWNKILEINWKKRFGDTDTGQPVDEPIEGTNGATIAKMKGVNALIRSFLSAVEIPVFGAAVLAILIIGEKNFWSHQVNYQTEPIASVGQWAPIVGAALAVLGSLYLFLSSDMEKETQAENEAEKQESNPNGSVHHCNCIMHDPGTGLGVTTISSHSITPPTEPANVHARMSHSRNLSSGTTNTETSEIAPTNTRTTSDFGDRVVRSNTKTSTWSSDVGNRRKVAKALNAIGNHLGSAAHDQFHGSEFKRGKALDFPEIPGEEHRNRALPQIREQYNQARDDENEENRLKRSHSRSSFTSVASGYGVERTSTTPTSPRSPSPMHSPTLRIPHAQTFPSRRSGEMSPTSPTTPGGEEIGERGERSRQRRDTLEVPSPTTARRRSSSRGRPPGPVT